MPLSIVRRPAATLLVLAGAATFGVAAGGIASLDGDLATAGRPAVAGERPGTAATFPVAADDCDRTVRQ
jgi:hypothetical protein